MKLTEIEERFNELSNSSKFICTQEEFDDFQNYGYLMPMGKHYLTRLGKQIDVDIIKQKVNNMNINLSGLINSALELSTICKHNKIFCMSKETYDKYEKQGFVVEKNNNKFYKFFENELWLIMLL